MTDAYASDDVSPLTLTEALLMVPVFELLERRVRLDGVRVSSQLMNHVIKLFKLMTTYEYAGGNIVR